MALLAWYPLNGDTKDYSGNGHHGEGNEIDFDDGKIGSAARFTKGSGSVVDTNISTSGWFSDNGAFTISAWIKVEEPATDNTDRYGILDCRSYRSGGFGWRMNGSDIRTDLQIDGSGGGSLRSIYTSNINLGEWMHLCTTYDGNGVLINFINGQVVGSIDDAEWRSIDTEIRIGRGTQGGWTRSFGGMINDVRIYDHALSKKEIKDLAKAKVLHYTFNEFAEPTENLLENPIPNGTDGWSVAQSGDSSGDFEAVKVDGGSAMKLHNITFDNNRPRFRCNLKNNFPTNEGKKLAVSFDIKSNTPSSVRVMTHGNGGTIDLTTIDTSTEWSRINFISSTDSATRDFVSFVVIFASPDVDYEGVEMFVRNLQVEEKSYVTPFTPSHRPGTILDSSGYENHANLELGTTPKWIDDSVVGTGAYEFFNSEHIEKRDIDSISTFNGDDNPFSFSAWVNVKESHSSYDGILSFYNANNGYTGLTFNATGDSSMRIRYWQDGGTNLRWSNNDLLGEWSHIAGVFAGKQIIIYQNGAQVASRSFSNNFEFNGRIRIGCYPWREDKLDGFIDDVRIYATALSESDVKEIYQSRASVDKGGNIISCCFKQDIYDVFTNVGEHSWFAPEGVENVDLLVVAGGGGGGADGGNSGAGGGGGAGGLVYKKQVAVSPGQKYRVTVGSGGEGMKSRGAPGENGEDSSAFGFTAIGGGGGGNFSDEGQDGGSGGGVFGRNSTSLSSGGDGLQPSSDSGGYGNAGGSRTGTSASSGGAGGGGANEPGSPTTRSNDAQPGGKGIYLGDVFSTKFGENGWFAGGGAGGSSTDGADALGGKGGGGANEMSGLPNTGGGGGGGNNNSMDSGNGGSGIVIIKY